jgi:hypothetical protein
VAEFLLEVYVAKVAGADAKGLARRARAGADGLSAAGRPVRCLQSILVAAEETCFLLFEAGAAEDVREAAARADLFGRISDAVTDHVACTASAREHRPPGRGKT